MDRKKGSRKSRSESGFRKSCHKKWKNVFNPKAIKYEEESFNTSAKKLKNKIVYFVLSAEKGYFNARASRDSLARLNTFRT